MIRTAILAVLALVCAALPAEARQRHYRHHFRHHHFHHRYHNDAPRIGGGNIRSVSGAAAHVAASAASAFQCLVTSLDNQGYPIRLMGGWRAHGSVPGSLHPAGLALDVNQLSRNVTRPPMPSNEIALANGCGLVSGRQWANGDSGHFQLGGWAGGGRRHYASRRSHRHSASAR